MKKIIAMITITVFALTLCSCVKTDNNIENYSDDIKAYEASSFMPGLDKIGKYNDVEYFSKKDEGIFPEYSMQLVVKYDEEEYLKEKGIPTMIYYQKASSRYDEQKVESVVVICEGGDSVKVKKCLTEMLSSFFGIGSNRVKVEKMKK